MEFKTTYPFAEQENVELNIKCLDQNFTTSLHKNTFFLCTRENWNDKQILIKFQLFFQRPFLNHFILSKDFFLATIYKLIIYGLLYYVCLFSFFCIFSFANFYSCRDLHFIIQSSLVNC